VVSLYLLTGHVVTPDPLPTIEVDPKRCSCCAGHKKHDEEFCGDCMPMVEHDRDERRRLVHLGKSMGEARVHPEAIYQRLKGRTGFNDSSLRL
jgi:hypothetical protein